MKNENKTKVSFVGTGFVASSFAFLISNLNDFSLEYIIGRDLSRAESLVSKLGAGKASTLLEDSANSELIFLAVPDDKISEVSKKIIAQKQDFLKSNYIFCHFSGALSSEILSALKEIELNNSKPSVSLASLHPVLSFSSGLDSMTDFENINCTLEGEKGALSILEEIIEKAGAKSLFINKEDKLIYHAAAVFCSNYLLPVINSGLELFKSIGLENSQDMLYNLADSALSNSRHSNPINALTGPIERGDADLVLKELDALSKYPEKAIFYRTLARETIKLAANKDKNNQNESIYHDLSQKLLD